MLSQLGHKAGQLRTKVLTTPHDDGARWRVKLRR